MKSAGLLLFLFCSTLTKAQGHSASTSKRIDTIHSVILNEDRYLWVHVPDTTAGLSRFPVLFILDGPVFFDQVINTLSRLSKESGRNVADEMIVIGIGNIWQRYRDYSPTHIASSPRVDSQSASISGGGEKFISFLENELFPHISSKYTDSPIRLLIGHSMGGLAVLNILLKHPGMFNYYAALDPSLWWDDQKLLIESRTILAANTFEKRTLFLAVANSGDRGMDLSRMKQDTSAKMALIRPGLTLVDYIENNRQNKLKFEWKYYKQNDHMTVVAPGIYDALKFFLRSF